MLVSKRVMKLWRALLALALLALMSACDASPMPPVKRGLTDQGRVADRFPHKSEVALPLDDAIRKGDIETARSLLERGEDPNARWSQSGDYFPLQEVLARQSMGYQIADPAALVDLLLKSGADRNLKDWERRTALHYATTRQIWDRLQQP
jgi:ankyrin repeat protein